VAFNLSKTSLERIQENVQQRRDEALRHEVSELHPADIAERGLSEGQVVNLHSHTREDGLTRTAQGFKIVPYDIPRGCAAAYFPETNVLVSKDSFAVGSRTPLSKFIPITVTATTGD
jgi:anaerobic selenocysteine-containing dehydrogenase